MLMSQLACVLTYWVLKKAIIGKNGNPCVSVWAAVTASGGSVSVQINPMHFLRVSAPTILVTGFWQRPRAATQLDQAYRT